MFSNFVHYCTTLPSKTQFPEAEVAVKQRSDRGKPCQSVNAVNVFRVHNLQKVYYCNFYSYILL